MVPEPMDTSDLVEIVHRNAYRPNIRWISHKASNTFSPPGTCTLLVGAWLPMVKSESDYGQTVSDDHVGAYVVATPQIPDETQFKGRYIKHRSWRALLRILVRDRVIRPSAEIERLLGPAEFEDCTRRLGCW